MIAVSVNVSNSCGASCCVPIFDASRGRNNACPAFCKRAVRVGLDGVEIAGCIVPGGDREEDARQFRAVDGAGDRAGVVRRIIPEGTERDANDLHLRDIREPLDGVVDTEARGAAQSRIAAQLIDPAVGGRIDAEPAVAPGL